MANQIILGDTPISVQFKDIKNVHLSVHPPAGRVSISAPKRMTLDTVRLFAIAKLNWIRSQQKKIRSQEREPEREYLERESHYVWGKRYLMTIIEREEAPGIELKHSRIVLTVRPGTTPQKRRDLLDAWYRTQLKLAIPALIKKWEPRLKVEVNQFHVQRMRTRWGSCNHHSRNIRLNTDLARKPRECLEYIIVHEMCHLLEPTHNARFLDLMDRFVPRWKQVKQVLNRLPVRHEDWGY